LKPSIVYDKDMHNKADLFNHATYGYLKKQEQKGDSTDG